MTAALAIEGYTLDYPGPTRALDDVSLAIQPGQVLGLVGESGSGKSSLAAAIMRYLPTGARDAGTIRLAGQDLMALSSRSMRAIRGGRIGMVFQDPSASLNPTLTLGGHLIEVLRRHKGLRGAEARDRAEAMLARVGLHHPAQIMARYPHEASGGEKQRVVIATAFAAEPQLLLLDEPTTALDVITARHILDLFAELQAETGVAALYISHDLALVANVATTVAVIHRGRIVETDPANHVFTSPREPYTRHLVASIPNPAHRLVEPIPDTAGPVLQVHGLTVRYGPHTGARDIGFALQAGEIIGIVGESGSGKSTIAKALVGLNPFTGTVTQAARAIRGPGQMDRAYRRAVQIVFQNPDASLNPRQTVGSILSRPLALYGGGETAGGLLTAVQLRPDYASRAPHELSGGEKQRVAIARAFAARPQVIICDEITSALDVSVQAEIIRLLLDLRHRENTAFIFITHDLNLVRQIAHRIGVMHRGEMVELAATEALGVHPYTRSLLAAVPSMAVRCP
jgi:peptide/nickel transport system ATP-binding protein